MSKIATAGRRTLKGDAWYDDNGEIPGTPAEWAPPMTEAERQVAALSDPDCQPTPAGRPARRIARAKFIRHKLGMSREQFAERFRIPLATLTDWEHYRSEPDAPTLAYLQVIERETEAVKRALAREVA
jgi:putative transcriptional regulator